MDPTPADLAELRALLGEDGVLDSEAARLAYESDALTLERGAARRGRAAALDRRGRGAGALGARRTAWR